jgi:HAMP domain-containing protein
MKIKSKFILLTAFLFLMIMILSVVNYYFNRQITNASRKILFANEIMKGVFELELLMNDFLLYGSQRSLFQWRYQYKSISELLETQIFLERPEISYIKEIKKMHHGIEAIFSDLQQLQSKRLEQSDIIFKRIEPRLKGQLSIRSQTMIYSALRLSNQNMASLTVAQQKAHFFFIAFVSLTLLGCVATLFIIIKNFSNPIDKLTSLFTAISMGSLDVVVDERLKASNDEIGELAKALERTLISLKLAVKSRVYPNKTHFT